ncbi:stage III sporulation protein AF [Candidatus Contubernalis alkaliaceticus]|uniref:stage III sporulation protein AF n=1 Tax=Candidatus Contubernalis alkaliaceticus TaxID=338645 RepID=UPI001F4C40D0|nr:stage III sporulation protein AF [Candidatus Contubernalis alkalaceticus]UNC92552.1 stage III sporulation protein AF [Candidatus Contubernalis alkalaceticus]
MLHTISQVVKSLVIIIILASFMELILPENKYQPYIKLIVGLVIIVSILNPMLQLFRIVPDLEMEILKSQIHIYEGQSYVDNYAVQQSQSLIAKEYKRRITGEIKKLAESYGGVEIVNVTVEIVEDIEREDFGNILAMSIALKPRRAEKQEEGIFIDSVVIQVGGEGVTEEELEELTQEHLFKLDNIAEDVSSHFSLEKDSIDLFFVK